MKFSQSVSHLHFTRFRWFGRMSAAVKPIPKNENCNECTIFYERESKERQTGIHIEHLLTSSSMRRKVAMVQKDQQCCLCSVAIVVFVYFSAFVVFSCFQFECIKNECSLSFFSILSVSVTGVHIVESSIFQLTGNKYVSVCVRIRVVSLHQQ